MINFIIPMAGEGSRFYKAGYKLPKPFISVLNKTMIENVLDNLNHSSGHYNLIAQQDHIKNYPQVIQRILKRNNTTFIEVNGKTEGAACTTLLAKEQINPDDELIIANSDQIVDFDLKKFVEQSRSFDASILVFKDNDPKWSYAKVEGKLVTQVKEKEVISEYATVGIYYYKRAADYFRYAQEMINNNDRHNNEFYVCPVYNYFIQNQERVGFFEINKESMHGLGTPEDLERFLSP